MSENDSYGEMPVPISNVTASGSIVVQTSLPAVTTVLPSFQRHTTLSANDNNSMPHAHRYDKNIDDTFVTFHREEETGGLIETSVSLNKNHVTARSVNSPQDVLRAFSKELNRRDKSPRSVMPAGYEYTPETFRADDTNLEERAYAISGNGIRHKKVVGNLHEDEYYMRESFRPQVGYSRGQQSPSGSPRILRSAEKHFGSAASVLRGISNYGVESDSSTHEGNASSQKIKLLPGNFTKRIKYTSGASGKGRNRTNTVKPSLEVDDYEFISRGTNDHHGESALFFNAVPVNRQADNTVSDSAGRRDYATKKMTRYHSLDSSRKIHRPTGYHLDWDYRRDHPMQRDDIVYVGDDGQLYVRNEDDYPVYDESYLPVFYSPLENYGGAQMITSFNGFDFDILSVVSTSDDEAYVTEKHKVKNYSQSKLKSKRGKRARALSKRDFKQQIPIYIQQRHRSESPVSNERYNRSRDRKRGHFRPIRVAPSSSSYDYDKDYKSYNELDASKNHLRQRRLDTSSSKQKNMSSINVTSFNDGVSTPYSLGISPSSINNNFSLLPGAGLFPSLPSPYTGFPYSSTTGHMDQFLQSNSLNMVPMKSYLDSMSTSLANIPASTIGTSPYISQQLLQQYGSDTLNNVETQDFFRNANFISAGVRPVEIPVLQSQSIPEMQLSNKEPLFTDAYTFPDSTSVVTNFLPSPTEENIQAQKTGLDDRRDTTQRQYNNADIHSRDVTHLNNHISQANKSAISSASYDVSDIIASRVSTVNTSRVSTVNTGQRETNHEVADASQIKLSVKERQLSYEPLTEKNVNNSAAQTDSNRHRSPSRIPTPPRPSPARPGFVPAVSDLNRLNLKRSVSRDSQTQTVKSPPPATLPKPKTERLTSPEPRAPSHQARSPVFSNQLTHTSVEQINHDLQNEDLPQPLGSNFFAISSMTVIERPGNTKNDTTQSIKKNTQKGRVKEFSAVADTTGEQYSVTQISFPHLTDLQTSVHPEADYDVYPRKTRISSVPTNHDSNREEMINGDHLTISLDPKSTKSLHKNYTSTIKQPASYSTTSLVCSTQEAMIPIASEYKKSLPVGYPLPHWKASNTTLLPPKYSAPESPKYPGVSVASHSRTLKSAKEVNRSPQQLSMTKFELLPHSARSSEVRSDNALSQIPQSTNLEMRDTDIKDIPYQFYKGDPSLLSPATESSTQLPSSSLHSLVDNKTESAFIGSAHDQRTELDRDFEDTGYIFYKGPKVLTVAPEVITVSVSDQTQQKPLDAEIITIPEGTDVPASRFGSKYAPVREVPVHTSPKSDVPIPPRDFDSDADNSEYIYTSKGWSHIQATPKIATVMYCTDIEDYSARYMEQLYRNWPIRDDPKESILDRFFRDCMPKYNSRSSLANTGTRKSAQLFDGPFLGKVSASTTPLKFSPDMDLVQTSYVTRKPLCGVHAQHRPRSFESSDLDSGVSLESKNSRGSLPYFDCCESDSSSVPVEDYSCGGSESSDFSMELGWDYQSCNESVIQRNEKKAACKEHVSPVTAMTRHNAAVKLQTYMRMFIVRKRHLQLRTYRRSRICM